MGGLGRLFPNVISKLWLFEWIGVSKNDIVIGIPILDVICVV